MTLARFALIFVHGLELTHRLDLTHLCVIKIHPRHPPTPTPSSAFVCMRVPIFSRKVGLLGICPGEVFPRKKHDYQFPTYSNEEALYKGRVRGMSIWHPHEFKDWWGQSSEAYSHSSKEWLICQRRRSRIPPSPRSRRPDACSCGGRSRSCRRRRSDALRTSGTRASRWRSPVRPRSWSSPWSRRCNRHLQVEQSSSRRRSRCRPKLARRYRTRWPSPNALDIGK